MLNGASYGGYGVCTISPSDLASNVDNLATKLARIEQILELLTGVDISASSLDEISQSLGTVTDATLINALNGWITEGTFSGVAISTLGWPFYNACTGQYENWPIVAVNADGSLNFGLSASGTACGQQVSQWNNASSVAQWATLPMHSSFGNSYSGFASFDDTNKYDPDGISYLSSATTLKVNKTGFYTISLGVGIGQNAGTGVNVSVSADIASNTAPPGMSYPGQQNEGVDIFVQIDGVYAQTFNSSRLCWFDKDTFLDISYAVVGTSTNAAIGTGILTLQLVKEV